MFGLTGLAARQIVRAAAITVAAFVLVVTANGPAKAETRTLPLYHVHLRESSNVTYKRNGRFIQEGLRQANWALRDWRESKPTNMDPHLLDMLWEIHRRSGARGPIHIIGGYRSPTTNRTLRSRSSGVAENSQHTRGKAIDFFIPGVPLSRVRDAAMQLQIGGVGYYPRSGSPFVHIDTGNGRYWPRMNRNELARIFPQGNTIYVPADGRPLPGYETALASYNQRRSGASVQMADARTGGRSLLARLFGGGADEAEDNAEVETAPVPTRGRAPAQAPAPARQAPQPQVQVAAAPAPRPALPAGVAMPERGEFDTSGRAPTPRAGIPEQTEIAALARVPVPTFAPVRSAVAAVASPAQAPAPAAEPAVEIAALEPEAPAPSAPGQLAYAVPTPSSRPAFEAVLQAGTIPVPVGSPEPGAVAEAGLTPEPEAPTSVAEVLVAALEPDTAPPALVTPVSAPARPTPQTDVAATIPSSLVAALEAEASALEAEGLPAVETSAASDAVSPSGKSGRVLREPGVRAKANTVAIEEAIGQRVQIASLVTSPERRAQEGRTARPDAGMLVVDVPVAVLESGFAPKEPVAASDRFTGSAVTFLPVRRLQ